VHRWYADHLPVSFKGHTGGCNRRWKQYVLKVVDGHAAKSETFRTAPEIGREKLGVCQLVDGHGLRSGATAVGVTIVAEDTAE
jgi:hypothetical protein